MVKKASIPEVDSLPAAVSEIIILNDILVRFTQGGFWQEQSPYLSHRFLKFNFYDFSVLNKNGNKIQDKTSRK